MTVRTRTRLSVLETIRTIESIMRQIKESRT